MAKTHKHYIYQRVSTFKRESAKELTLLSSNLFFKVLIRMKVTCLVIHILILS